MIRDLVEDRTEPPLLGIRILWLIHLPHRHGLELGQPVRVTADAQDSEPFMAEISWTSNQAEEKQDWSDGGYFEAYAMPVADVPAAIAPGMSVMGELLEEDGR